MSGKNSRSLVQKAFDIMAEQNIKHSRLYSEEGVRTRPVPTGSMELKEMPARPSRHRDAPTRAHRHVDA